MIGLRFFMYTLICCSCFALECYTGWKYVKGRSIGTSTMTCKRKTDFCYNITADLTQYNEVSKAGCSTYRCMISPNKCISQVLLGHQIKLCCCNTGDLCNSKLTNLTMIEKVKERVTDWLNVLGQWMN